MSIVVLIDFITILLTPGIYLIQICIQFIFIKNIIKMHFSKSFFLSFKATTGIHYLSQCSEINCVDISKDFTTDCRCHIFNKKKLIIIIYVVKKNYRIFAKKPQFFFLNKSKSKLKIGQRGIVVLAILSRMFFFFSEINIEPL